MAQLMRTRIVSAVTLGFVEFICRSGRIVVVVVVPQFSQTVQEQFPK
jgi:hypothetical protein